MPRLQEPWLRALGEVVRWDRNHYNMRKTFKYFILFEAREGRWRKGE